MIKARSSSTEFLPGDASHKPRYVERLTDFDVGVDALITETNFTDAAYQSKIG